MMIMPKSGKIQPILVKENFVFNQKNPGKFIFIFLQWLFLISCNQNFVFPIFTNHKVVIICMRSPWSSLEINKVVVVDKSWCICSEIITSDLLNFFEVRNTCFKNRSWAIGAIDSSKSKWLFVVTNKYDFARRTYLWWTQWPARHWDFESINTISNWQLFHAKYKKWCFTLPACQAFPDSTFNWSKSIRYKSGENVSVICSPQDSFRSYLLDTEQTSSEKWDLFSPFFLGSATKRQYLPSLSSVDKILDNIWISISYRRLDRCPSTEFRQKFRIWSRSFRYNWPFMHFRCVFAKINSFVEETIVLYRDKEAYGPYIDLIGSWLCIKRIYGFIEVSRSHNSTQVLSALENIWTTKSSCSREVQTRSGFFSVFKEWISFVLEKTFCIEDVFSLTGSLLLVTHVIWTISYDPYYMDQIIWVELWDKLTEGNQTYF